MTHLTANIAGTIYPVLNTSYKLGDRVDQASSVSIIIYDASATYSFQFGQAVTITDTLEGVRFTGFVYKVKAIRYAANTARQWSIDCTDNHIKSGWRTTNRTDTNQYSGVIAAGMANDVLSAEGITANYAIREDSVQSNFAQGTLTNVVATSNLGGALELAPAGSPVTIAESTTAQFSAGTLTNMTASNNTLSPTATGAIKIVAVQTVSGLNNSYSYIKFYSSAFLVGSGRYLAYDIYIDPDSPEAKIGVDFIFTDGSSLRDQSIYNDIQNKPPHPNTDLAGFATGQWYHRKMLLDNFSSNTVAYATIGVEGDKSGTYTAWIKNVFIVNVSDSIIRTLFSGTLNTNPPEQISSAGYVSTRVSVVNTYDCTASRRVSPAYSIDAAKLLKSAFLTYKTTLPTGYTFNLLYSLDGGNSYTVCANNASLPNMPAGLSIASKSVQFLQYFSQSADSFPDESPLLHSLQLVVQPSYASTKSDVTYEATISTEWNAGGTTLTNVQAPGTILQLVGAQRNWDDGSFANQTLFGGKGAGPNLNTTCLQFVDNRQYRLFCYQGISAWSRCDFAGQFANGIIEFDVLMDRNNLAVGCVYRTNSTSNYDAQYGYCVEIQDYAITLSRGSNSNSASDGTRTQIGSYGVVLTQQTMHHIQIVFSGSSHQVYFDSVLAINVTDSTYTSTGYCGPRITNIDPSNGYVSVFDNFGIVKALSGTWQSPSVSLSSAGTYGGSVISWQDVSTNPQSTVVLIESSINAGSTWQTISNGGTIPGLTIGQSLSGISVKFRITLTTVTAVSMPQVQYFTARILGQFSSTGTRIAPVLSLANALIAGATVINWTTTTPSNTSVVVASSLNGSSYTNVNSGDAIPGITTQPAPTIDTFNTNSSASYTNTAQNGGTNATWTWDTANSRVQVAGGTNALLLLLSPNSVNDVDAIIDLSRADAFGIVLNYQNGSNFFYFEVHDNSATSSPGTIILNNLSGGILFTLGTTSINFVRGAYYRFKLSYIAGIFTLFMDGKQIFTFDQNPYGVPSPGRIGLWSKAGTSHCTNFFVQPSGQSLSGVSAYSKITLSSTDPLATPQLTNLVVCALHPMIGLGSLIPKVDYQHTYLSHNFDDLAKKSGTYYWNIDAARRFIFHDRMATPAPWILWSGDQQLLLDGPLTVEYSGDLYRNRHTVTGVRATQSITETKIGDGQTTSFVLQYPVETVITITLNGQSATFGQKGIDTGKDFYWSPGSTSLAQDASEFILSPDDLLTVLYTGQYVTSVSVDNTGQFPGTTTQAQFATLAGGTGIVEVVEDMSQQNLNISSATTHCNAQLQRYGVIGRTLSFRTRRSNPSLGVGQYLSIFIPEHGMNDAFMLITQIDTTQKIGYDSGNPTQIYFQSVTAVEGPNIGNGWKLLASAFQ